MRMQHSLVQMQQGLFLMWCALTPRRRRQLLGLQFLSLLAAMGEVANLGALLPFLRVLANPQEGLKGLGTLGAPLRHLAQQHLLLSLGLSFMMVVSASTLIRVYTIRSQLRLAALISADLGDQVFGSVLRRPFSWHLDQNSSTVLGYLTKDVDQVSGSIQSLLVIVVNFAIVLLLGGSLVVLAPKVISVVVTLLAIFYLIVFRFTRGNLRADGQRLTSSYQKSLQVAQEALGGIRDVLLDQSHTFFQHAYSNKNLECKLAGAAINCKGQVPRYLIEGFAVLLIVALSLGLALSGQGIERQLPLLGTLSLGAYRLLQPLQQCFVAISGIQANQASLLRLEPFIYPAAPINPVKITRSPIPNRQIDALFPLVELKSLSFRYNRDAPWVLRDVDLRIQRGERIAFVGSTGSGKSTCSDLILGLLSPSEGRLIVEGEDIHGRPGLVEAWQRRVAHVPQLIYLSDASFAENIAFGLSEDQIDLIRVQRAAEQARIADLIESTPKGYRTVVGERGVRLSGGQRQRIGIARALYKQSDLLVLDEATSALDNLTEAEVMAAVEALDRSITIVLIAHRLSTVQRCDRVVLLDQGKITACGSFEELRAHHKSFQRLASVKPTSKDN